MEPKLLHSWILRRRLSFFFLDSSFATQGLHTHYIHYIRYVCIYICLCDVSMHAIACVPRSDNNLGCWFSPSTWCEVRFPCCFLLPCQDNWLMSFVSTSHLPFQRAGIRDAHGTWLLIRVLRDLHFLHKHSSSLSSIRSVTLSPTQQTSSNTHSFFSEKVKAGSPLPSGISPKPELPISSLNLGND